MQEVSQNQKPLWYKSHVTWQCHCQRLCQCFVSRPPLSCPALPLSALSSAVLRATEWLQWNVMTMDWTKPCIHGPSSHSESLRLEAVITERGWPVSIYPSLVLSDKNCPPLHHHMTAISHISHTPLSACISFTILIHVVDDVQLKPNQKAEAEYSYQ